jgi:carbon-monoxide dehydrogenase large subunit
MTVSIFINIWASSDRDIVMTIDNAAHRTWRGRIEDDALLRGRGRYASDAPEKGQAYACFVRSPHAFARIIGVDVQEAQATPGVVAILTAADLAGVGSVARPVPLANRDGSPAKAPFRPALAGERVLHAGEPVALVVAETLAAAQDAAELVTVDYEPHDSVVDLRAAVASGAPQLFTDAPGNIAADWALGADAEKLREIESTFSAAKHVARLSLVNQRIVVASMEPRGATASYDEKEGYRLRAGSQGVGLLRDQLAAIIGIERGQLRVISEDVGGGFGMKAPAYPEYVALLVAARRVGRPVHWMSTRSEAFLTDQQARDTITDIELALDGDGRFLALHTRVLAAMGAYVTSHGAFIATSNFARCLSSVYRIPQIAAEIRCVFTNTVPTGPYRGAGRPEANYAIERIVDEAARVSGIDRLELRRRNFIAPQEMPYKTPINVTYDSGDFPAIFAEALEQADVAGFPARRASAVARGKRLGLGISCFLEHAGGSPVESAAVAFPGDGTVALDLALGPTGQGHATVFRRLAADRFDIPEEQIVVRLGDTRFNIEGGGTVASRGTMTSGTASVRAIETVIEKGRKWAARLLEAAEVDLEYRAGVFCIAGTDRAVGLFDAAAAAAEAGDPLDSKTQVNVPQSFPNGCHVCEVEIDPETGIAAVTAYTAIDDCGVALDPVLVEGQIQGGVAQGIGQALYEDAVYDGDSGQLVAGSFMDYTMPRADTMPMVGGGLHPVPCRSNPLGVKGTGEAGTTAALAAVMNAVSDALPGTMLDMPATPEKVWRACQGLGRR